MRFISSCSVAVGGSQLLLTFKFKMPFKTSDWLNVIWPIGLRGCKYNFYWNFFDFFSVNIREKSLNKEQITGKTLCGDSPYIISWVVSGRFFFDLTYFQNNFGSLKINESKWYIEYTIMSLSLKLENVF